MTGWANTCSPDQTAWTGSSLFAIHFEVLHHYEPNSLKVGCVGKFRSFTLICDWYSGTLIDLYRNTLSRQQLGSGRICSSICPVFLDIYMLFIVPNTRGLDCQVSKYLSSFQRTHQCIWQYMWPGSCKNLPCLS